MPVEPSMSAALIAKVRLDTPEPVAEAKSADEAVFEVFAAAESEIVAPVSVMS